ncbi:MAG: hypothetical protein A2020_00865 [Lentisphaerae bacterium GWF2_45_14]|nr:MAG: hypothetical protein A2020_00865 [Lentisphaerae bacterium GWF2_45_14]
MIILYIFLGVLAIVLFLQWDKLKNNGKIRNAIDSVKNTCILKPFHFLAPRLLALPRKTWNCLKSSTLWQWAWPRPLILFSSTLLIIVLYGLVNFFHDSKNNDDKRNLIFKILVPEDADRTIYNTLIPILLGALPAFLIWSWRNNDKRKDQEHVKEELEKAERKLKIEETNNDWDNFLRFQEIALHDEDEERKDTAIRALGVYYDKEGDFPKQVHQFFKNYLEKYWTKNDNAPPPPFIKAIYDIINKRKLFLNHDGGLTLQWFYLFHYTPPDDKNLKNSFFQSVKLDNTKLIGINFSNSIISNSSLNNISFIDTNLINSDLTGSNISGDIRGTNFNYTNLISTNLFNVKHNENTTFKNALYLQNTSKLNNFLKINSHHTIPESVPTKFPNHFNPQAEKMVEFYDFYERHKRFPTHSELKLQEGLER